MSNQDIFIILTFAAGMFIGMYIMFTDKPRQVNPNEQKIREWKRNKKKWAKHKFDV